MSKKLQDEKEYFICWVKLDEKYFYLIWISSDIDSVYVENDFLIPIFKDEESLTNYLNPKNIEIRKEKPILHDLDKVKLWLEEDNNQVELDCNVFLSAWNLFSDISNSINKTFLGSQKSKLIDKIYDKLFFACNLPSITPKGKSYNPVWENSEIDELKQIMLQGMRFLRENVKEINKF